MTQRDLNIYIKAKLKYTQDDINTEIGSMQKYINEKDKKLKVKAEMVHTKGQIDTAISDMQKLITKNLKVGVDIVATQAQINNAIAELQKLANGQKIKIDAEINPTGVGKGKDLAKDMTKDMTKDMSGVTKEIEKSAKKATEAISKSMDDVQKKIGETTQTLKELAKEQEDLMKNARDQTIWGKMKKDNVRMSKRNESEEVYDAMVDSGAVSGRGLKKEYKEVLKGSTTKGAKPLHEWLKEQKMDIDEFKKQIKGGLNIDINVDHADEKLNGILKAYKSSVRESKILNKELQDLNKVLQGSTSSDILKEELEQQEKLNKELEKEIKNRKLIKVEKLSTPQGVETGRVETYKDTQTGNLRIETYNNDKETGESGLVSVRDVSEIQKNKDIMTKAGLDAQKIQQRLNSTIEKATKLGMNSDEKFAESVGKILDDANKLGETSEKSDFNIFEKQLGLLEERVKEEEKSKKLNLEEVQVLKQKEAMLQRLAKAQKAIVDNGMSTRYVKDIREVADQISKINTVNGKDPNNKVEIVEAQRQLSNLEYQSGLAITGGKKQFKESEAQKSLLVTTNKWSNQLLDIYDKIKQYNIGTQMEKEFDKVASAMKNITVDSTTPDKQLYKGQIDNLKREVDKQVKTIKGVETYRQNLEKEANSLLSNNGITKTEKKQVDKIIKSLGKADTKEGLNALNNELKEIGESLAVTKEQDKLHDVLKKVGREGFVTQKVLDKLTDKVDTTTAIKDLQALGREIDNVRYKAKFLNRLGDQEKIYKDLKNMRSQGVIDITDNQMKNIEKTIDRAKQDNTASSYKDVARQIREVQKSASTKDAIKLRIEKLKESDLLAPNTIKNLQSKLSKTSKSGSLKLLANEVKEQEKVMADRKKQFKLGEDILKDNEKISEWRNKLKKDIDVVIASGKDMNGEFAEYKEIIDKIANDKGLSYIEDQLKLATKEIEEQNKRLEKQQQLYEKIFNAQRVNEVKQKTKEDKELEKNRKSSIEKVNNTDILEDTQKRELRKKLAQATTADMIKEIEDEKNALVKANKEKLADEKAMQAERVRVAKARAKERREIEKSLSSGKINEGQRDSLLEELNKTRSRGTVTDVSTQRKTEADFNTQKKEFDKLYEKMSGSGKFEKSFLENIKTQTENIGDDKNKVAEMKKQLDILKQQNARTDIQTKREKELRKIGQQRTAERKKLLDMLNAEVITQEQFNKLNEKIMRVKNTSGMNAYQDAFNGTVTKSQQEQIKNDEALEKHKQKLIEKIRVMNEQSQITAEQSREYAKSIKDADSHNSLTDIGNSANNLKRFNSYIDNTVTGFDKMREKGQITEEQFQDITRQLNTMTNQHTINFDTRDARQQIERLKAQVDNIKSGNNGRQALEYDFSNRFTDSSGNATPINDIDRGQVENVLRSNDAFRDMELRQFDVSNATGRFNAELQTLDGTLRRVQGEIDRTTGELRIFEDRTRDAFRNNLSFVEQFRVAMTRVPIWMGATTIFFGTTEAIREMLTVLVEVDTQMTELKRVMDEGTNFDAMLQNTIDLSKELGNNLTDVNQSLIGFARQGFDGTDALEMTKTAIVASNVSELTAEESMNNLVAIMTQFNLKAEDSIEIVDKLNEVDNNFNITTKDLSDGLAKAGATAQTFGVTIDEMIGHITAIGMATKESGSIVGNSLKTIYSRMTTLPKAINALAGVGVEIKKSNGDVKTATEILDELALKWEGLSGTEQQTLGVQVAGTNQLSRLLALMNNYENAQKAINTSEELSDGSAMRENAKYMESMQAQMNRLATSWKEFALAIGNNVAGDAFRSVMYILEDVANAGTALANTGMLLPGIFGLIGLAIYRFIPPLATATASFNGFIASLFGANGAIRTNIATHGLLRASLIGLGATTASVGGVMVGSLNATVTALGFVTGAFKTLFTFLARAFLPIAIFAGIGMAIGAITEKYAENREEQRRIQETRDQMVSTYRSEGREIDLLVAKYEKLSGQVKTGEIKSNDSEYIDVQNQIAELMPSWIAYEDEKGNAHLRTADAIAKEVEQLRQLATLDAGKFLDGFQDALAEVEAKIEEQKKQMVSEDEKFADKFARSGMHYGAITPEMEKEMGQLTFDEKSANLYREMEIDGYNEQKVGLFKEYVTSYAELLGLRDSLTDKQREQINAYIDEQKEMINTQEEYDKLENTIKGYVITAGQATNAGIVDMGKEEIDRMLKAEEKMLDGKDYSEGDVEKLGIIRAINDALENGYTQWDDHWEELLGNAFGDKIAKTMLAKLRGELEENIDEVVPIEVESYSASDSLADTYGFKTKEEAQGLQELATMYDILTDTVKMNEEAMKANGMAQSEIDSALLGDKAELERITTALEEHYNVVLDGSDSGIQAIKDQLKAEETMRSALEKMIKGELDLEQERTLVKALEIKKRLTLAQEEQTKNEALLQSSNISYRGAIAVSKELNEAKEESATLEQELLEQTQLLEDMLEEETDKYKELKDAISKLNVELEYLQQLKDDYTEGSKERIALMKQEAEVIRLQMQAILDLNNAMIANGDLELSGSGTGTIGGTASMTGSTKSLKISGNQDFVNKLYPYASYASGQTNIPVEAILSQWALETGWGTSRAFSKGNNLAGIKSNSLGSEYKNGAYAGYNTIESAVNDWIRNMNRDIYSGIRKATDVKGTISAMDASPWAEDTQYGSKLTSTLNKLNSYLGNVTSKGATVNTSGSSSGLVIPQSVRDYYAQLNEIHSQGYMDLVGTSGRIHKGHDYNLNADRDLGMAVKAIAEGSIRSVGYDKSAGNYVTIQHLDGTISKYFHLLKNMTGSLKVGQSVSAGANIGQIGNTGQSSGAHLHLQIEAKDANGKTTYLDPVEVMNGSATSVAMAGEAISNVADIDWANLTNYALTPEDMSSLLQLKGQLESLVSEEVRENIAMQQKRFDAVLSEINISEERMQGGTTEEQLKEVDFQIKKQKELNAIYQESARILAEQMNKPSEVTGQPLTQAQKALYQEEIAELNFATLEINNSLESLSLDKANLTLEKFGDTFDKLNLSMEASSLRIQNMVAGTREWRSNMYNINQMIHQQIEALKQKKEALWQLIKTGNLSAEAEKEYQQEINQITLDLLGKENELADNRFEIAQGALEKYKWELEDVENQMSLSATVQGTLEEGTKEYNEEIVRQGTLLKQKIKILETERQATARLINTGNLTINQQREMQRSLAETTQAIMSSQAEIVKHQKTIEDQVDEMATEAKDKALEMLDEEQEAKREALEEEKELALEAIEDEMEALQKAHDSKMEMYDDEIEKINEIADAKIKQINNDSRDRDHDNTLTELQDEKSELEAELTRWANVDNSEGRAKRKELSEEIAEIEKQIEDEIYNYRKDISIESVEEMRDLQIKEVEDKKAIAEKEIQDHQDRLDKQREATEKHYEDLAKADEKYFKEEKQRIIDEHLKAVEGSTEETIAFIEKNGERIGETLQTELIDKLKEAQVQLKELAYAFDLLNFDQVNQLMNPEFDIGNVANVTGLSEADLKVLTAKYMNQQGKLQESHLLAQQGRAEGSQIGKNVSFDEYMQTLDKNQRDLVMAYIEGESTQQTLSEADLDLMLAKYMREFQGKKDEGAELAKQARDSGSTLDPYTTRGYEEILNSLSAENKLLVETHIRGGNYPTELSQADLDLLTAKYMTEYQGRQEEAHALAQQARANGSTIDPYVTRSYSDILSSLSEANRALVINQVEGGGGAKISQADLDLMYAKYMTEYQGKTQEAHELAKLARDSGSTIDVNKDKSYLSIMNSLDRASKELVNSYVRNNGTPTQLSQADLDLMKAKYMTEYQGKTQEAHALAKTARDSGSTIDPYKSKGFQEIMNSLDEGNKELVEAYINGKPIENITNSNNEISTENNNTQNNNQQTHTTVNNNTTINNKGATTPTTTGSYGSGTKLPNASGTGTTNSPSTTGAYGSGWGGFGNEVKLFEADEKDTVINGFDFLQGIVKADTGTYTGDQEGLLYVHKKELVLNPSDTNNVLEAVRTASGISNVLNSVSSALKTSFGQASGSDSAKIANVQVDVNIENLSGGREGFDELMKQINNNLKGKGVSFN